MEQANKYEFIKRIGYGGMAEVFQAKLHLPDGAQRVVAVKRIHSHLRDEENFVRMFLAEAGITLSLNHPNIVQAEELGRFGDNLFIAMEFVDGLDLARLTQRSSGDRPILTPLQIAYVGHEVARGLSYAHALKGANNKPLGLVHRDISPQNILLSKDGEVKITDFGLAKATALLTGTTKPREVAGKIAYISPEQAYGYPVDRRADIYSLGVTLYEQLAWRRLFLGETDIQTLENVRRGEIPPLPKEQHVPATLELIVRKALARDRAERYQTASQIARELQEVVLSAEHPLSGEILRKPMMKLCPDGMCRETPKEEEQNSKVGRVFVAAPVDRRPPSVPERTVQSRRRAANAPPPIPSSQAKTGKYVAEGATKGQFGDKKSKGLAPTQVIGSYVIERRLPHVSERFTYLAKRRGTVGFSKKVVIRRLDLDMSKDASHIGALVKRLNIAEELSDANVVGVSDVVAQGSDYFVISEYIPGRDLATLLESKGEIAPEVVLHAVMQVLHGLESIHGFRRSDAEETAVVHGDICAENILLTESGLVKLLGFGLGSTTVGEKGNQSELAFFQSPPDQKADLYQVGIVLYECLSGKRLEPRDLHIPPIRNSVSDIDPKLEAIMERALHVDPKKCFQTAEEFYDALAGFVPPSTAINLRRSTRKYLAELNQESPTTPQRPSVAPEVRIKRAEPPLVYVLVQDQVFTEEFRVMVEDPWEHDHSFEYRLLDGREAEEQAVNLLNEGLQVPVAVVFGELSVALEAPLLAALRRHCCAKIIVTASPQSEILTFATNFCGLDSVVQVPFELMDLTRVLTPTASPCRLECPVIGLQETVEALRTRERELMTAMDALAKANIRAATLAENPDVPEEES